MLFCFESTSTKLCVIRKQHKAEFNDHLLVAGQHGGVVVSAAGRTFLCGVCEPVNQLN